jgi:hypothetical protein
MVSLDEVLHKTMVDVREHELSGMVCNDTNGLCLAGIHSSASVTFQEFAGHVSCWI